MNIFKIQPVKIKSLNGSSIKRLHSAKAFLLKHFRSDSPACYFDNPNTKEAYNLGLDLYNNPEVPVEQIIKKYALDVEVIDINNGEKRNTEDNCATIFSNRNKNFEPVNIKIYSPLYPKNNSKINKLLYSLAIAHEFTHYMQLKSDKDKKVMTDITCGDYDYLRRLMPIGDGIFDEFDGIKFPFTDKIFNFFDKITEKIYSVPIPRKKSFKKEDILASQGLKSVEEFNNCISVAFDKIFEGTIEIILYDKDSSDESIREFIREVSKDKSKLSKFKNDLIKYCSYKASTEREAYQTESLLSKKILNIIGQLNIDSYIMYYSMLENALRKMQHP